MPTNTGIMKFVMTSNQFSNPDPGDDIDPKFKERYWGHRATGWCEITPVPSKVDLISAKWIADNISAENPRESTQELRLEADISSGVFEDGTRTADTCKAPEGRVQLYVDKRAVGEPIELLFQDKTDADGTVHKANARVVDNGKGGSYTHFTYVFTPSKSDYLVPDATTDNKHIVSLMYLRPDEDSDAPRNYLESVNPADHPEEAPKAPVAIDPIDPNPKVTPQPDPENTDGSTPPPTVVSDPNPTPTVPGADPTRPGDKTYGGTITTTWDIPSAANPYPGRVTLKVATPSTGAISITGKDGELYEAKFECDENKNPIRNADGTYTLVLDPQKLGSGELTFSQKANGAYTGTTWVYTVNVDPNPKIPPKSSVTKTAENLTNPGGPVQPGQRIKYTLTARNDAAGSAWNNVVISDHLPACLQVDEATLRLDSPTESLKGALKAATGVDPILGEYALSAPDSEGRRTLTVPAGRVYGVGTAVLTFECTVNEDAAGQGISSSLVNIAKATGTRPNPDSPGNELPENPGPSDPATPPKSPTVAPADPKVRMAKTLENVTTPGAKVTRKGDVLRYRIELANEGAANSCLVKSIISDPLPTGLEPVAGTLKMTLSDGTEVPVDDAAYDKTSRTIAVTSGDLWGGRTVSLTFDVTVGEAALGANNANIALVHGTIPSKGPGGDPDDPEPGKPQTPPGGDPVAFTPPVMPPTLVGDDPGENDVKASKTAENLTSDDGRTRVGDEVRYAIELKNDGPGTAWMDAIIKDVIPKGLEPASGTIKVVLPNGSEATVDDSAYDVGTRTLAVAVGHLYGGQQAQLIFTAIVTEDAVGADIGNVAEAVGDLPSKWDPEGEHPEPGKPFSPPGGWPDYERDRSKVVSEKAYPPGGENVTAEKLAQTGDSLGTAVAPLITAAAASILALLLARRRRCQTLQR